MKKCLVFAAITLLTATMMSSQTPGISTYYEQYDGDIREYIEYIPGNLPIIISAPHGGVKQSGSTVGGTFYPDDDNTLPDRSCGVNERDDNTDILVREIQDELFELTGCYAHVIISNLHRSKMDPNREVGEAACGDADAIDHWTAYHDFIDDASEDVELVWGKGIFIDLHGQSHSIPRIEVGYNITSSQLNDSNLNDQSIIDVSTIKNLVTTNIHGQTHEQLVRGDSSLGQFFHEAAGTFYAAQNYPGCSHNGTNGYRAIPSNTATGGQSCDDTRPYLNPYFDGDYYNNRRHGSGNGANDGTGGLVGGAGAVDGMMTEVNRRVRDLGTYNGNFYDNRPQTLVPFAKDYAQVLLDYIEVHYDDYADFSYADCAVSAADADPIPTIEGVAGGVFSGTPAGIVIDANTGVIDVSATPTGTYTVYYAMGDCGYYKDSTVVDIVAGTVGYVDVLATGTADGKSWVDAHTSLEAALTAACRYDTIKVAEGLYVPATTDQSYSYPFYSDLVIVGGFETGGGAYDPAVYITELSGNIGDNSAAADNLYHVVAVSAQIAGLQLSSLTISAGTADGTGTSSLGSGIYNEGSLALDAIKLKDNASPSGTSTVHNVGVLEVVTDVEVINSIGL